MIRWIKSWLTMKRHECRFVDIVSGANVYRYVDCHGDEWMAEWSRWFFRVPLRKPTNEKADVT